MITRENRLVQPKYFIKNSVRIEEFVTFQRRDDEVRQSQSTVSLGRRRASSAPDLMLWRVSQSDLDLEFRLSGRSGSSS